MSSARLTGTLAALRRRGPALAAAAFVVAIAAWIRFDDLGLPARIYFDENYYVTDARSYLLRSVEEVRPAHPPLGKWVIAAGIAVVGDTGEGWRAANALAGTVTVGLVVLAGVLLTNSWWPGLLAGLLVAVDGVAVSTSRIGMLDASLSMWVALAFVLLVLDQRFSGEGHRRRAVAVRHGAGIALGLALATKWSGLFALLPAVMVVGWSSWRHRPGGGGRALISRALYTSREVVPALLIVPIVVYAATYLPWLVSYTHTETALERCAEDLCGSGVSDRLAGLVHEQRELVSFHRRLEVSHPYRAAAWRWPLLSDPTLIYLERCAPDAVSCPHPPGEQRRILALGNPALWWPTLLALPILAVTTVRRRWWAGAAVLAFAVVQWLPWTLTKPGFSFYLAPMVPFAALVVALTCRRLRHGAALAAVLAVAALSVFVAIRPMLVGLPLTEAERERITLLPSWDN